MRILDALLAAEGLALLALLGWSANHPSFVFTRPLPMLVYAVFPMLVFLGILNIRKSPLEQRARLTLLISSLWIGVYCAQAMVMAAGALRRAPDSVKRLPAEASRELEAAGPEASPSYCPCQLVKDGGAFADSHGLFPVSGISSSKVLFCKNSTGWVSYMSDECGFNNPMGLCRSTNPEFVLVGDSFTHGVCVGPRQDIASVIRRSYPKTLNLGCQGNGPLAELATLREYVEPLKPKAVLWLYYQNDLDIDLIRELEVPSLTKYLSPSHSQNLRSREAEIDAFWRNYRQSDAPSVGQRAFNRSGRRHWVRLKRFIVLDYLFGWMRIPSLLSIIDYQLLETYWRILAIAREKVLSSGGEFHFVYLPSQRDLLHNRQSDRFRPPLIDGLARAGVPVVDLTEPLSKISDERTLFFEGHYSERGYAAAAAALMDALGRR